MARVSKDGGGDHGGARQRGTERRQAGAPVACRGRLVHGMLTARVKAPSQQRHPWDHYGIPGVVPAAEAFRPIDNSKNRSMF